MNPPIDLEQCSDIAMGQQISAVLATEFRERITALPDINKVVAAIPARFCSPAWRTRPIAGLA